MKKHHKPLSRQFPAYHPKAGQPTYFVEKVWKSIGLPEKEICFNAQDEYQNFLRANSSEVFEKPHTIRAGNNVKVGDMLRFFVWRGKPYHSKQIIVTPYFEVKKVYDFEIEIVARQYIFVKINNINLWCNATEVDNGLIDKIAKNDGLATQDFKDWFNFGKTNFKGQIICWNENINY